MVTIPDSISAILILAGVSTIVCIYFAIRSKDLTYVKLRENMIAFTVTLGIEIIFLGIILYGLIISEGQTVNVSRLKEDIVFKVEAITTGNNSRNFIILKRETGRKLKDFITVYAYVNNKGMEADLAKLQLGSKFFIKDDKLILSK